jgi:uncharacterized alpha-E superfamily protein
MMLSRVAESLYWLSANIERCENLARFIEVQLSLMPDLPQGEQEQWMPLVLTTGDQEVFAEAYKEPTRENVIRFLTFDADYSNSILTCIGLARENARSIRDVIGSEMWESINSYFHLVHSAARDVERVVADPYEFYSKLRDASYHFKGVTDATFSHDERWHFLELARMLERADKTSRILDVKYYILLPSARHIGTPIDDLQWTAVLRSVSGFEMYRQLHHLIQPSKVVQFLMLDRRFPRAVFHCLDQANRSLHAINDTPVDGFQSSAEQLLGKLRSELGFVRVEEIIGFGLHQYIDQLQTKLNELCIAIQQQYFARFPVAEERMATRAMA